MGYAPQCSEGKGEIIGIAVLIISLIALIFMMGVWVGIRFGWGLI